MLTRAMILSAALAISALPAVAGQPAGALIAAAASRISDPSSGQGAFSASIAVPILARFTLDKYANRINDDDRQRFTTAFEAFLGNTSVQQSESFTNARAEVVGSVDHSQKDAIVETRVTPKDGEPMTVGWCVMLREGAWRVVDVEVLGLWLAIEKRAQIAAILGKPRARIDDVIRALEP